MNWIISAIVIVIVFVVWFIIVLPLYLAEIQAKQLIAKGFQQIRGQLVRATPIALKLNDEERQQVICSINKSFDKLTEIERMLKRNEG